MVFIHIRFYRKLHVFSKYCDCENSSIKVCFSFRTVFKKKHRKNKTLSRAYEAPFMHPRFTILNETRDWSFQKPVKICIPMYILFEVALN